MPEIEHNDFKSADHTVANFLITVQIRPESLACRLTNNKLLMTLKLIKINFTALSFMHNLLAEGTVCCNERLL